MSEGRFMVPFNPLDMENLGRSIVAKLEECQPRGLGDVPIGLTGAGVYAIYYRGEFGQGSAESGSIARRPPMYEALANANVYGCLHPIYVGKAVPEGSRRGLEVRDQLATTALRSRLSNHRSSLHAAGNLNLEDFEVRWLVVEDIWIPLGETAMIRRYRPVWNAVIDGFGNKDQGGGRDKQVRSLWDTVHPGRAFARRLPARPESAEQISQTVRDYLEPL